MMEREGGSIGFIFTCHSASFIVIQSCHALISTKLHSEIKQLEDFQRGDQYKHTYYKDV